MEQQISFKVNEILLLLSCLLTFLPQGARDRSLFCCCMFLIKLNVLLIPMSTITFRLMPTCCMFHIKLNVLLIPMSTITFRLMPNGNKIYCEIR